MTFAKLLAANYRNVYFGKNWTGVALKETLADVTYAEATRQIYGLNTIAVLVCHLHYYTVGVTEVLRGGALTTKDADSFAVPEMHGQADWEALLEKIYAEAETFAQLIEKLPDERFAQPFVEEKYGNYHRNLHGIVEHAHYHLGQIVFLKKILRAETA